MRFTKVFKTELGHKYILVECSVIALCLPVMSTCIYDKVKKGSRKSDFLSNMEMNLIIKVIFCLRLTDSDIVQ